MTSQQLLYYKTIIDCQSFSEAAEQLFLSQPLLTRTVKNLEAELDVKLIDRDSKHFHTTNAGQILYEYAHRLLSDYNNVYRAVHDSRSLETGEVRLSVPTVLLDIYFVPIFLSFQNKHPHFTISITEEASYSVFDSLKHQQADLGLVMMPLEYTSFLDEYEISPLVLDQVGIIVQKTHRLAKEKRIDIRDLEKEQILTFGEASTVYQELLHLCRIHRFEPQIAQKCMTAGFISQVISGSNYVGVLPRPLIRHILTKDTVMLDLDQDFPWQISLIHHKDAYQDLASSVMEKYIVDYFAENYQEA